MRRKGNYRTRRRGNYRRDRHGPDIFEWSMTILVVILVVNVVTVVKFIVENWVTISTGVVVLALVCFCCWFVHSRRKTKQMGPKLHKIFLSINKFSPNLPRHVSQHSESIYQAELGGFLKGDLEDCRVSFEERRGEVRPDIVIDSTLLAIEIKALKPPTDVYNKRYNKQHINSIFKKIITYKAEYEKVAIVIFNAGQVKHKKWNDYEKMKEACKSNGIHLFEK